MKKAFEYFNIAAISEYADIRSYVEIGLCYLYGTGIEKNRNKAKRWFQKAANQNENASVKSYGEVWLEEEFGLVSE